MLASMIEKLKTRHGARTHSTTQCLDDGVEGKKRGYVNAHWWYQVGCLKGQIEHLPPTQDICWKLQGIEQLYESCPQLGGRMVSLKEGHNCRGQRWSLSGIMSTLIPLTWDGYVHGQAEELALATTGSLTNFGSPTGDYK